jgi:hypothetical protein
MFDIRVSTFQLEKGKFEKDELAFREREKQLPAIEQAIEGLVGSYNCIKPVAHELEKGCLENHSAMTIMSSRVTSILSNSTALELRASHEILVDCVSDIVAAFSRERARNDVSIRAVIARLATALEKMKSNGKVVGILQNLEDRDDYAEIIHAEDDTGGYYCMLM